MDETLLLQAVSLEKFKNLKNIIVKPIDIFLYSESKNNIIDFSSIPKIHE